MDTDWCLTCARRINAHEDYCSMECTPYTVQNDYAGIEAWAAAIPPGAPTLSASSSSSSLASLSRTFKPKRPRLICDSQRPIRPTLCMSTPHQPHVSPSLPVPSPQLQISRLSSKSHSNTDSSLPTPVSTALDYVKSWVPRQSSASPTPAHTPAYQHEQHTYAKPPPSPSPSSSIPSPFSPFPTSLRRPTAFMDDQDLSPLSLYIDQKTLPIISSTAHPRPHQYQAFPPQSNFEHPKLHHENRRSRRHRDTQSPS